jgi:UDP-3-O-[3-hydroxymyristoyl] N-acetylglucosamine deacetylase
MILQKTIAGSVSTTGVGLHSGKKIHLSLKPAPVDTGVVFYRIDEPTAAGIKATAAQVSSTTFCTTVGTRTGVCVGTVEHLLSALSALEIDNVFVELDGSEVPIMDGSASPWLYLLEKAGLSSQKKPKRFLRVKESLCVQEGDSWARLSPYDGFKVRCEVVYEHPAIPKDVQELEVDLSHTTYRDAIGCARTYGFLSDYEALRAQQLALGGSLDNALVFDQYKVMNDGGLRYREEVVRHKILDVIGDLYLLGANIIGAYHGYKPGHTVNVHLVKAILAQPSAFEWVYGKQEKSDPTLTLQPIMHPGDLPV